MTEDPGHRMEIPRDVAAAEGVPEDLDSTQLVPYQIPSTRRRRNAAVVYLIAATLAAGAPAAGLPTEMVVAAGLLAVLGGWHLWAAHDLAVLDSEALEAANRSTDFPVGHASAAVGFDGWRSRPVWNVLVFDADEPPTKRGLVRVDARNGKVLETYVEDVARSSD